MATNDIVDNNRRWVVLKYGGTSVSTAKRWSIICDRVKELKAGGLKVWIVISALSQVTNLLQSAIREAVEQEKHLHSFEIILQKHFKLCVDCGMADKDDETCFRDAVWSSQGPTGSLKRFKRLIEALQVLRRILEGVQLTEEASPKLEAKILAFGELLSTALGHEIMIENGISETTYADARKYLTSSETLNTARDDIFLHADVSKEGLSNFDPSSIRHFNVVLTQGFISSTSAGHTCLLGRGGSDTSASLFAVMLSASRIEIWTDVHGLFTSDPRCVPEARLIRRMDFRQAQELAAMGAKVLHPRCIAPAQWAGIPIHIRNTNDPTGEFTEIVTSVEIDTTKKRKTDAPKPQISAVAKRCNMTLVTLTAYDMCGASGFLSQAFTPFEQLGISVDLIATSQYSISVTLDHIPGGVDGESFGTLIKRLKAIGCQVSVKHPCATVSIVGQELRRSLYCIGGVLEVLEGHEVYLVSESAEDLNLSFVVDEGSAESIVKAMHEQLFLDVPLEDGLLKRFTRSESMDESLGSTWTELRAKTM